MTGTIHATAVAIGERAVVLRGPSGAGKSDLALRLIDRGAVLIADDRVALMRGGHGVLAAPPPTIAGLIEVRGVGIVTLPHRSVVPVALVVDLGTPDERLPAAAVADLDGIAVPVIVLDPREVSAALKVERALLVFGLPLET